ncbi:MAG: YkgJ family cysteine cluster protein [Deltaproteobacteria bacterium]|nr:YkgJ family cysteine cluster protein [Deltaproteobacteria bacterium]
MKRKRSATDEATIRVPLFGEERELVCRVRLGRRALVELLPAAREISRQVAAVATDRETARGRSVSCRPGCAHCCRQLVPVAPIEALALAKQVGALAPARGQAVRLRFAEAVARMEELGILDRSAPPGRLALQSVASPGTAAWEDVSRRYFAAGVACPFLDAELCGIYDERPVACREYAVTTPPALCERLDPRLEAVPRPIHTVEALAGAGAAVAGLPGAAVPLALALEWAGAQRGGARGTYDGETMFWTLLEQLGTVARPGTGSAT